MSDADFFKTLSLPRRFNLSDSDIVAAYYAAQAKAHPDQHSAPHSENYRAADRATSINEAYRALKNPLARAQHLLRCYGVDPLQDKLSIDFLEAQLGLRQQADAALQEKARDHVDEVLSVLKTAAQERVHQLTQLFEGAATRDALMAARKVALELQFIERFSLQLDEQRQLWED